MELVDRLQQIQNIYLNIICYNKRKTKAKEQKRQKREYREKRRHRLCFCSSWSYTIWDGHLLSKLKAVGLSVRKWTKLLMIILHGLINKLYRSQYIMICLLATDSETLSQGLTQGSFLELEENLIRFSLSCSLLYIQVYYLPLFIL